MSDSPSNDSLRTSVESLVSGCSSLQFQSRGKATGSVSRSKSLSNLNIDYPTESLSKSFHGLLKAPSFSELVAVQLPENPCIHDIYTISPGPVYHELPSLVTVESNSKMAESKQPSASSSACVCDESEKNIYCKFCDEAKVRNLIDDDDCQFDHFLPKDMSSESKRASLFIPDLRVFGEDAGIDSEILQKMSASKKPWPETCEKPKSLLETVMSLDVHYVLGPPAKTENSDIILNQISTAPSDVTSSTADQEEEYESTSLHKDIEGKPDSTSVGGDNEDDFDAASLETLSLPETLTDETAQSDSESSSPSPDTVELAKPEPVNVQSDSGTNDEVQGGIAPKDACDDYTEIQGDDENIRAGGTPELSESWVDLSKSNPPTPPHPQQLQQSSDPVPDLERPRSATSQHVAAVLPRATPPSSHLPPPQPHVTTSHSSGPFIIPHSMDSSMLVESSFLRHSEVPMTSASLTEQYDSVGPLGFGNGEEYLRLLKEAQKESSNQSSAIVSLASSRRDSPRGSPKSPPNSPNTELASDGRMEQLGAVYINYYSKESDNYVRVEKNSDTDWIWDWSSRPDQLPPKEWRFSHPGSATSSLSSGTPVGATTLATITTPTATATNVSSDKLRRGASLRRVRVGQSALFSRGVLYTLFITNVLSFLLGTGIGVWLSKRTGPQLSIATLPFN